MVGIELRACGFEKPRWNAGDMKKYLGRVIWNEKLDAFRTGKQNEKQEVGDYLSVCVLNLEFVELKSCFIRNVFL